MRSIVRLLTLLVFVPPLVGQPLLKDRNLYFDHISLEDGLSQATVLCSWQDQYGFMWFGTRDGLNRYDGYSFTVYRTDLQNPHSLANNVITDLQGDSSGNLWIISGKGLEKFIPSTGQFEYYGLPGQYPETGQLRVLSIDAYDQVWVGGSHGLYYFDRAQAEFKTVTAKDEEERQLIQRPVYALHEQGEGYRLWIGTSRDGIYRVDLGTRTIDRVQLEEDQPNARVEDIVTSDNGDSLWIGTYGDGLYLLDKNGAVWDHYHVGHADKKKRLAHNNIRALEMDGYGNVWVGTFNGLDIVHSTGQIRHVEYVEREATGLSHGSVRSIFKDNKGSLWIGTYFGGVNVFDYDNQRFDHFYHIPGQVGSLSYNVVGAFSQDTAGRLIIGTERGGVNVYHSQRQKHSVFDHDPRLDNTLQGSIIKALYTDAQGYIWAGVFRGGLNRLDMKTGDVKHYPGDTSTANEKLGSAIVNAIIEDHDQRLWIGTDKLGGLQCFDLLQEKYVDYPGAEALKALAPSFSVKNILLDSKNRLWLATRSSGAVMFVPETGEIKTYSTFDVENEQITIDEVNHIQEDHTGELWIATYGKGVIRLNPHTGTVKHYHRNNGLPNDVVFGTLQDDTRRLWFFTLNGLSLFDRSPGQFKNYPFSAGFPIEEINEGAFYKTRQGEFVVGGSNGYVRFHPGKFEDNAFVPPIVLTHLKLSNREVLPGDDNKILSRAISETREITLTYDQSVVTFEFTALSYLRPENNQYAYILEGFDKNWSYVDNKRSVTFTNLPEGDYVFRVKGSNNDGVWNEEAAALAITVLPPPWKTWWAFVIYAIAISCGFWLIRYNALKGIKLKHTLKLEQLETERLKDVHKLKLEYFTDVSHEFRTPLTLIVSPLEEIMESGKPGKWMRKRLKVMYLNCKRLLHLIDQVLEVQELESGHSKVKLTPVRLASFMGNIVDSFKTVATKNRIDLVYTPALTDSVYLTDADKIEKIFFNLLSNSFKFTRPGGEIKLDFSIRKDKAEDVITFTVMDTGTGISAENLDQIFDRFYKQGGDGSGAGIGLSLTQSLVHLLNGQVTVTSKLEEGTTFVVRIPMKRSKVAAPLPAAPFVKPLPLELQPSVPGNEKEAARLDHYDETLLVVEDNPGMLTYLAEYLGKSYRVITAVNGRTGLDKARKQGPSLIISDVMMDEMDGMELCKAIKSDEGLCHIPVILLTAKTSYVNRLEGLELGADDYIHKPFIMKELETRTRNILENRKKIREKYKATSYLPSTKDIAFNSYDEKLLKRVVNVIQGELDNPSLSVEYLSSEVGISRVQLFRKLKSLVGLSPADFIKDFRMKKAAQLLRTKNVKVAEVAYEVGFQDVEYFSKCFKKTYKINPSKVIKERTKELGQDV